jgi:transposase
VDLTDEQWEILEPLIPAPPRRTDGRGRPWRDPRDVLDGILWVLRTGAPWRDLPERYPPYQTCHRRFQRWNEEGVLEEVLRALADRSGLPLSVRAASASPHEVTLVGEVLDGRFVSEKPERLIGDRAYDSDPLDAELAKMGIEMIAPHRNNRKKPKTQDGRKLRRYKRRWKMERLFVWLHNFRRLVIRYERRVENYLGFVHLGCIVILLRYL